MWWPFSLINIRFAPRQDSGEQAHHARPAATAPEPPHSATAASVPVVVLKRTESSAAGTFGHLVEGGTVIAHTAEPPWRNNLPNISCIPAGRYRCEAYLSPVFKRRLYRVCGVPGRAGIAIHRGNLAGDRDLGLKTDTAGCILLGARLGTLHGQPAVLASAPAVGAFFARMGWQPFDLVIIGDPAA